MPELPPLSRDQRKVDSSHLHLLSIFHFVGAGLAVFGILFLLLHYAMFHAFLDNPSFWQNQHQTPPPMEFFAIFKWFYLFGGLFFLASGIANLISAFCLRARKGRTISIVVAALNCVFFPLGTALGVFTLVVLVRDSVVELYETL